MTYRIQLLLYISLIFLHGCASKPPTIAHTHIGHALAGWHDTPKKAGLFVTAENKVKETLAYINAATQVKNQLTSIQQYAEKILLATDPQYMQSESLDIHASYGTKQALMGAVDHITFASTSADASANLKQFSDEFSKNAVGVLDRCDLLVALSQDIINTDSIEVAQELLEVVASLANSNLVGSDLNGNESFRDSPEEYGISQLGQDLQAMIDREDPPYTTVDSWYLFNLVRLPSGLWIFKETSKGDHSHAY